VSGGNKMNDIGKEILKIAKLLIAKPFSTDRVDAFRKEFLLLMKNIPLLDNYDKVHEMREYINRWNRKFEDFVFNYLIKDMLKGMKYDKEITESDWEYWDNKLRSNIWDFVISFQLPIDFADEHYDKESRFYYYQKRIKSWERSIRDRARLAWKTLSDFVEWYELSQKKQINIEEPIIETFELNGIKIVLKRNNDYMPKNEYIQELAKAIQLVKIGAAKRLPILSKFYLPIFITLVTTQHSNDASAIYVNDHIELFYVADSKEGLAKVIAHEYGHGLYDKYLSDEKKNVWYQFMSGNYEDLDLREILKTHGSEKDFFENKKIKEEDPLLYLKLESLIYDPAYKTQFSEILTMDDLREYLEKGNNPVLKVHGKPISGYAAKNNMEAFAKQ
jgi:hypothetical protein